MSVLNLSNENFKEEILESNVTAIVDFYADWCGPCKMQSPIIDKIAEELGDSVKVGKVNSDENLELAERFGIMSIPTVVVFKNGQETFKNIGLVSKEDIISWIK